VNRKNARPESKRRIGRPPTINWSLLFGFDFFISYRRSEARVYANDLYTQLRAEDYFCFLDDYESPPGTPLTSSIERALRRSRVLILIATSESLQSEWVGREVEKFGALGRPIIPINIQGALNEKPLEGTRFEVLKRKDVIWIDESLEISPTGHPTDEVLGNLRRLFVWRRAKRSVQTLVAAVIVALLAFSIFSFVQKRAAVAQTREALIASAQRLVSQAASLQRDLRPHASGAVLQRALDILPWANQDNVIENLRRDIWQRFRYLDLRPTTLLEGHIEAVQDIDISSDGKLAVTSSGYWQSGLGAVRSQDDSVRLWDLDANKQLAVLGAHNAAVLRVRFDPKATVIVSASQDGVIKIWNVLSRNLRCEASVGQFKINIATVDFSRDGKEFFAAPDPAWYEKAGSLWWWSALDCQRVKMPAMIEPETTTFSWANASPRMWTQRIPSGEVLAEWHPADAYTPVPQWFEVWAATMSPSGGILAVAPGNDHGQLADCAIILWDTSSGKVIRRLVGHKNHVRAVAFSPDGQRFASGDEDGLILIWNVATGNEILKLEGHAGAIRSLKFAPGESLLSGSTDHTFRRWLFPREPTERELPGRPFEIAVTRDGKYRFQTDFNWLEKRDSTNEDVVSRVQTGISAQAGVESIAVHPLLPLIVTEADKKVTVRNAGSLEVVQTFKGPFGSFESLAIGGEPPIVVSSDSSSDDSMIRVWDVQTGNRISKINRPGSGEIAITPDGRLVAAGCGPWKVCFWNPRTVEAQGEYLIDESARGPSLRQRHAPLHVSITPDGQMMFFTTFYGPLVAWDVSARRPLATRYFGSGPVVAALDTRTAIVAVNSTMYVWDLQCNDILKSWNASKIIRHLARGKDERTILGVTDGLGLLEWQMPALQMSAEVPQEEALLAKYDELVGMQVTDATSTGRDVAPLAMEPSEAQLLKELENGDTNAQLLALSWLLRKQQINSVLVDNVTRQLRSSDGRVREAAVRVLGRAGAFPPAKAAAAIASALTDSDVEVRTSALFSLENLGSAAAVAVPQLRLLLNIDDEYSERLSAHVSPRDMACYMLATIGRAASGATLDVVRQVEASQSERQRPPSSCVRALGEIGDTRPEVIKALVIALAHPDVNMRDQAATALDKLSVSSIEVLDALIAAAQKDPDSVEIAVALENVRARERH
jgi:WD40 repeat protein